MNVADYDQNYTGRYAATRRSNDWPDAALAATTNTRND
jgi:hypothetical protein